MTLEKLLIFGFALAVGVAITTIAFNSAEDREPQYTGYKKKITDLIDLTK